MSPKLFRTYPHREEEEVFLETPLPKKQKKYLTKFCPMKLGQNIFKCYFVCFLGNGVSRKNAFDIY